MLCLLLNGFFKLNTYQLDPFEQYGQSLGLILYCLKLLSLIGFPIMLINLLGILIYPIFPDVQKLRVTPFFFPYINIRVVTRGLYPDLIRRNVTRNLKICEEFGLDKFVIEVLTDREIFGLPKSLHVTQLVVPNDYRTKTGAKFKARALQYALEPSVNKLQDEDWIVHLDEETILTYSAIVGILNFTNDNKHHIGQGLITYGKEEIVNWITTLADSLRVATDLGSLRFSLKNFHKPIYSFKGSFIICQKKVEKLVSFESGIKGSIAEDSYFAVKAVQQGYSFEWVEGEMLEKSPFTFLDFIKQRKRWVQGMYLLVNDNNLKKNFTKLCFTYSFYNWAILPIQLMASIILTIFPISISYIDVFLNTFNSVILLYLCLIGTIKSFNFRNYKLFVQFFCIIGALLIMPLIMLFETIALIWGIFSDKKEFFIVIKNQDTIEV